MVEPGDRVRLLDFGVCTPLPRFLRAAEPRRRTAHVDRWESGEDNFAGTIGYSDPNTHDGTPATVRSDIYSLAVILYEMLTGRRHCDPDSMAYRHIDSAEFPLALAGLAEDLRRNVAHNPFERHHTMAEFVQRLEIARSLLARAEAEARPGSQRSRLPVLLLGVALGVGCAAFLVAARGIPQQPAGPEPQPTTVELPRAAPIAAPPSAPVFTSRPGGPDDGLPPASIVAAAPEPSAGAASTAPPDPPRLRSLGRDSAAARRKLGRLRPVIAACVKGFGSSLNRRVPVALLLDPAGRVQATTPAKGNDMLANCVAAALIELSFAPGTPSPLTHTFDLTAP